MIESVKLKNFKGFHDFKLDGMTPIVLLSGKNNVGKTSFLESIFLFYDHKSPESFLKLNNFRNMTQNVASTSLWESLFFNQNVDESMRISLVEDGVETDLVYSADRNFIPSDNSMHPDVLNQFVSAAKSNYSLKYTMKRGFYEEFGHYTVSNAGIFSDSSMRNNAPAIDMKHCQFINEKISGSDVSILDWFGKAELAGEKESVLHNLKIIDPNIEDIRVITVSGQPTLYASVNGKFLPLKLCGDGINRLLYMILTIKENRDSIIFIDEIETGYHYSIYPQIWEVLAFIAEENNCQIIATTHSLECIFGAISGIGKAGKKEMFSYYRLEKTNDTVAHRFTYNKLEDALNMDLEVR